MQAHARTFVFRCNCNTNVACALTLSRTLGTPTKNTTTNKQLQGDGSPTRKHTQAQAHPRDHKMITNLLRYATAYMQKLHLRTAATDDPAVRLMYFKALFLVMAPPSARTHSSRNAVHTTTHATNMSTNEHTHMGNCCPQNILTASLVVPCRRQHAGVSQISNVSVSYVVPELAFVGRSLSLPERAAKQNAKRTMNQKEKRNALPCLDKQGLP